MCVALYYPCPHAEIVKVFLIEGWVGLRNEIQRWRLRNSLIAGFPKLNPAYRMPKFKVNHEYLHSSSMWEPTGNNFFGSGPAG